MTALPAVLHAINPLYSASGFAVGLLVGFTGVGGGSLMTPLLVLLFGIHPATAVGTDLLYAGLTKISGSMVHAANGAIDWKVTRRLASGSVPAAALTLWTLAHFGVDSKGTSVAITTTLGFALILTAVTLLFRQAAAEGGRSVLRQADRQGNRRADDCAWRGSRRAGVDLVGRRRRHRGHGPADALPQNADRAHRRIRHRACGSADAHRWRGALVDRVGRLAAARFAAGWFDSRHRDRKPLRLQACQTAFCVRCSPARLRWSAASSSSETLDRTAVSFEWRR